MKTDPNKYCINFKQHMGWAIIHDVIAHPLMGLTLYSKWSINFHNYTSQKAWKRPPNIPGLYIYNERWILMPHQTFYYGVDTGNKLPKVGITGQLFYLK